MSQTRFPAQDGRLPQSRAADGGLGHEAHGRRSGTGPQGAAERRRTSRRTAERRRAGPGGARPAERRRTSGSGGAAQNEQAHGGAAHGGLASA
jgi:hypothetical protein